MKQFGIDGDCMEFRAQRAEERRQEKMMRNSGVIEMTPEWVQSIASPTVQCGLPDGRWVPARPYAFQSLRTRIHATWMVWTGRADALVWPGQ